METIEHEHTIDENTRNVGMGYSPLDPIIAKSVVPFYVNNLGELMIEIHAVSSDGTAISSHMMEDENARNTAGGVSTTDGKTIIPLTVDVLQGVSCLRVETL